MRIIGGALRRSRLPVPDAPGLRPTPDRVRETLFNWLGDVGGWRVVDAFAGTGALGFEAASRGAARVLMIERSAALAAGLRAQAERLKVEGRISVRSGDAPTLLAGEPAGSVDLLLLDPPFDAPALLARSVEQAVRVLAPGGWVYVESAEPWQPPASPSGTAALMLHRSARAGSVHYHLARAAAADPTDAPTQPQENPPP